MNISQLTAFRAVMTSASLTEAADRLGRTQPAISAAIKSLEDQLGVPLFERRGRKLIPVPEAQYLLNEASGILERLSQVRRTMRSLGDGQLGSLNVAAMPGPVAMLFPKFIAHHISGLAGISTSILARSSTQISELARAQSIDFGFADAPEDLDGGGLYRSDVIVGDCFVALPKDHRLAGKTALGVRDLDHEAFGSLQSTHIQSQKIRQIFEREGRPFNPTVQSQTFLPILQFVLMGQCCAILDPLTVVHVKETRDFRDALAIVPMVPSIRYEYAVISPQYRPVSIAAAAARDAWKDQVEKSLAQVGARPEWLLPNASTSAS